MSRDKKDIFGRWFICTVLIAVVLIVLAGGLNVIVDPYFHYHKPIMKYRLNDERYINDGIARSFDYDAVIIGNSLFQNFKTSQYDELMRVKSIKLPYSGAGIRELWQALGRVVGRGELSVDLLSHDPEDGAENIDSYAPCRGYNDSVREVMICTDTEDVLRSYSWHRYSDYPIYLYDDDVLNDVNYIFNKDTFYRGTLYNIGMTLLDRDSTTFDEYSSWVRDSGWKIACNGLDKMTVRDHDSDRQLSDGDKERIYYNIYTNMVPVIKANPDIRFILLIPPASLAKWAEYYSKGELTYVLDGMEYMLSLLTEYDNVEIYGFDDAYEITGDLDRYCDKIHYDAGVSEWLLEEVSKGEHRIDRDNYREYTGRLRAYYMNYDFTILNEYIED